MRDWGIEIITTFTDYGNQINEIGIYLSGLDSMYAGIGGEHYDICYENGAYNVKGFDNEEHFETSGEELEEKTGMTMEEIVDLAYEDQELLEEMMFEMKEYELHREKTSLWKKLLWVNGISLAFILLGIISKLIDSRFEETS